jgi:Cu+-exporting ATPase
MEKVDTLVVDKTGTPTEGKPKVVQAQPAAGREEAEVLRMLASVECASEHPLAMAMVNAARERELQQGIDVAALSALKAASVRLVMLSGDGKTTAEAVGREFEIDDVIVEVSPQDKASVVQRLQREGRVVAMAGDGVNDAPALAAADVGIAMGTGTDVAMESAGVTLLKGDLLGIGRARVLSRATMRNIRQNLFLSFAHNVAGTPLAAGVRYPYFGLLLSPWVAAAAITLSSVSMIAKGLRLRRVRVG